jgi:hypothetical protein
MKSLRAAVDSVVSMGVPTNVLDFTRPDHLGPIAGRTMQYYYMSGRRSRNPGRYRAYTFMLQSMSHKCCASTPITRKKESIHVSSGRPFHRFEG